MTYTLSNLIRDAMGHMGRTQARMLTVTGGTPSTLIDTNLEEGFAQDDDDSVVNGTLIVTYDAGGAGAAPEGEMQRISAYSESAEQFTVDTPFTAAPANGDEAMFITSEFPLIELKRQANSILQELGYIALVDASITTAANTVNYTLPVGLKYSTPLRAHISSSDGVDRLPIQIDRVIPAPPGTAGTIVLRGLPAGRTVYLEYEGIHPTLTTYSSVLSETIDPALASWALADSIWRWKEPTNPYEIQRKNEAQAKAEQFKALRPIHKKRTGKWFSYYDYYRPRTGYTRGRPL